MGKLKLVLCAIDAGCKGPIDEMCFSLSEDWGRFLQLLGPRGDVLALRSRHTCIDEGFWIAQLQSSGGERLGTRTLPT